MVRGQGNPIIRIIVDNNNNDDNKNIPLNGFLTFSIGGGGKCSHQLWPSGFKIFVGKYNSFYADDLEKMT